MGVGMVMGSVVSPQPATASASGATSSSAQSCDTLN